MDVKIALLNGDLDRDIYKEQPEGFAAKGKEQLVCKLKRLLYGLNKASVVPKFSSGCFIFRF